MGYLDWLNRVLNDFEQHNSEERLDYCKKEGHDCMACQFSACEWNGKGGKENGLETLAS